MTIYVPCSPANKLTHPGGRLLLDGTSQSKSFLIACFCIETEELSNRSSLSGSLLLIISKQCLTLTSHGHTARDVAITMRHIANLFRTTHCHYITQTSCALIRLALPTLQHAGLRLCCTHHYKQRSIAHRYICLTLQNKALPSRHITRRSIAYHCNYCALRHTTLTQPHESALHQS